MSQNVSKSLRVGGWDDYKSALHKHLARLDSDCQLAFAVSCADRLMPWVDAFLLFTNSMESNWLRPILYRLMLHCLGHRLSEHESGMLLESCEVDMEEYESNPFIKGATWAIAATYSSIQAATAAVCDNSVIVGNCVVETIVDDIAAAFWIKQTTAATPADVERIERESYMHPFVQEELARQEKVLELIMSKGIVTSSLMDQVLSLGSMLRQELNNASM